MYIGYQNDKIVSYTETPLDKTLYNLDKVEYTDKEYVFSKEENAYILKPEDWDDQIANARKVEFLKEFFPIAIPNSLNLEAVNAYYRRKPKGYQSAVESMNVLFNINAANTAAGNPGLPAGLITLYQEPDFHDPDQCTEDWLVSHQIILPQLTAAQFMELYAAFNTAWVQAEH